MSRGLSLEQMEFLVSKGVTADEMLAFAKMSGSRSKGAERTAKWRANKAMNVTESVTSDVTGDASPPPIEDIHTPQPVSNETVLAKLPGRASKTNRGTRLPSDFQPPEDWIDWAMAKRGWSRAEAIDEAECFARYWQAKPGREACKLDWPKTWQNWVVNSRRGSGTGTRAEPSSFLEYHRKHGGDRTPAPVRQPLISTAGART